MCRWIAYAGRPVFLEDLVCAPKYSLVAQSLHAEEGKCVTNGDGFGIGWYAERETPGLFRDVRPAWSDENLSSLCAQVKARIFFAHVRASTGTATARANCHPFVHGKVMFMHNGQVGDWPRLRRRLEAMIPDELYPERGGTTDSEAIFLAAIAAGLERDPLGAMVATLARVRAHMREIGARAPLRFSAALTDGQDLYAFRWSSDERAPTLYWRENPAGIVVVSEPLDETRADWREVPKGGALIVRAGRPVEITCMEGAMRAAA